MIGVEWFSGEGVDTDLTLPLSTVLLDGYISHLQIPNLQFKSKYAHKPTRGRSPNSFFSPDI